jgi:uncharacterized membrane protein
MKKTLSYIGTTLVAGLMIIVPVYLAILLLLKGMKTVAALIRPIAGLLPDAIPAETMLSLLLVLGICFVIGFAIRTQAGKLLRERLEKTFFERIPGYALLRSFTQQLAGSSSEKVWKPALVFTDDGAYVLAFIIEELEDGRYTVFVPSIPTPLAGAFWIVDRDRVHPVNVPFTEALKVVSKWGSGAKDLVANMETK